VRIAALDVGSRTIGVAVSDSLGITAQPSHVLEREGTARDVETLLDWSRELGVTELVVGLPLELDGSEALRARRVRVLVDTLRRRFEGTVHLWDERLSTVAAERVLLEADLNRRKRKRNVDKLAAAIILQGFLDHRRRLATDADREER
jgi:putative Holliday junction resolvase